MTHRHRFQVRVPIHWSNHSSICGTKFDHCLCENWFSQIMEFAQQMSQCETQIECRIAPVDYFVVKKNQPVVVNQDVLWAEIAMHERQLPETRVMHQLR